MLVDLGMLPREYVKGGGRNALNGVRERRRKLRQRPPFSAAFPTNTQLYFHWDYVATSLPSSGTDEFSL